MRKYKAGTLTTEKMQEIAARLEVLVTNAGDAETVSVAVYDLDVVLDLLRITQNVRRQA